MKPENQAAAGVMEFLQNFASLRISNDTCLLCGDKSSVVGVFIPNFPEAYGAPEGKERYVRYCLCSKCYEIPDKAELAEKVIYNELTGRGINYAG